MAKECNGGGSGAFVAGLIVGAVVGGALAAFFAPRPDEETQQALRGKQEELRAMAEDFLARAKEMFEEQKARMDQAVEEAKAAAEKARTDVIARFQEEADGGPIT
jgi:gas vesicle protein